MFVTEREAATLLFSKEARPSLLSLQRYRRKLGLPAYHFGRRIIYDLDELEQAIKQMKRPEPDAQ